VLPPTSPASNGALLIPPPSSPASIALLALMLLLRWVVVVVVVGSFLLEDLAPPAHSVPLSPAAARLGGSGYPPSHPPPVPPALLAYSCLPASSRSSSSSLFPTRGRARVAACGAAGHSSSSVSRGAASSLSSFPIQRAASSSILLSSVLLPPANTWPTARPFPSHQGVFPPRIRKSLPCPRCVPSHASPSYGPGPFPHDPFPPASEEEVEGDWAGERVLSHRPLRPPPPSAPGHAPPHATRAVDGFEEEMISPPALHTIDGDEEFEERLALERSRTARLAAHCAQRSPRLARLARLSPFQAAVHSLQHSLHSCFYLVLAASSSSLSSPSSSGRHNPLAPHQRVALLYLAAARGMTGPFLALHVPTTSPTHARALVYAHLHRQAAFLARIQGWVDASVGRAYASMWALDAQGLQTETRAATLQAQEAVVTGNLPALQRLVLGSEEASPPTIRAESPQPNPRPLPLVFGEAEGPGALLPLALTSAHLHTPQGLGILALLLEQGAPLTRRLRVLARSRARMVERAGGEGMEEEGQRALALEAVRLVQAYTAHLDPRSPPPPMPSRPLPPR
jgi:hypothetical protein